MDLAPPAARRQSRRVLSTEELRAVWLALADLDRIGREEPGRWDKGRAYTDATRLLILTGVRRENVLGMRVSEFEALDKPEARWIIPGERMKGGEDHVVPLSPQALAIVEKRLRVARRGLLFPGNRGSKGAMTWSSRFVSDLRAMADLVARRKIPVWPIHCIRHTLVTHLTEDLGVPEAVGDLILAHKRPGVQGRYQRAERLNERRDALCRWAAWVEALQFPSAGTK